MASPFEHEPGLVGSVGAMIADSLRFLGDLLNRIVCGIKDIAPIALMVNCTQSSPLDPEITPSPMSRAAVSALPKEPVKVVERAPSPVGDFSITFYYVVTEEEVASKAKAPPPVVPVAANDNTAESALTSIVQDDHVTLYEASCQAIAEVSREFASQLALQGTGKLRDGRVVNIWGHCACGHSPCFKVTAATWGTGGTGRHLQPFRTVAVDPKVIKLGSLLYVPFLEGRQMPGRAPWGGFVHDGCVVADDVGGGIKGTQLDLFVGRRGWFLGMSGRGGSHSWAKSVPVYDGATLCERKGRHIARKAGAI